MTEPGLRERKKQDTRAALSAATLELALEHGLGAVTVEQIAARAGVSYRTFFNYFSGKEEALLRPDGAGLLFAPRLQEQDPALPPLEAARRALGDHLAALDADSEGWRLRLTVLAAAPEVLPRLVELGSAGEREMTEALAERTGLDADRDVYPALLAAVLGCALRVSLTRWHATGEERPLAALFDEVVDVLAAGLPAPRTD
ncbi:TetR/AcrR family transcriptional regulator [Blastococcus sp. LR1]|uniref:TetR/AcrR family transcriptional regulator n=1 Tax=Blastococcus sp. LR1 TaxID=2877000 RepID=UPI001CCDBBE5|nr:TetR family transcriptional regulator [Blastococcus sp. LR1]MCA0145139.1 TetR family transcriptional regulator [Blastococcus sp. LR1]